uniref:Zinc finger protein 710 n=1 Tax=Amazona collaria TaxID=241587 RepID=A0A8B9IXT1_9PSIT
MLLHSDIKPYSCRFCGRGFAYPSELKAHEVKHESGRCHVCVECGLDFSTLTQLKRHLSTHQGPTLYQCLECSKSFHYRSQLQNHMLNAGMALSSVVLTVPAEGEGEGSRRCSGEAADEAMRVNLAHPVPPPAPRRDISPKAQLSVSGERSCCSAPCPAPVGSVRCLHGCCCLPGARLCPWLSHPLQGVKEFKCEVCGREFTLQANMKRHMLIHTSVRPYQCHICFKTFVQKQTLKTHMIVHSPVKPFKCKVRGGRESFNRMYNLLGHMHLHAGSKPFKCPYCSSKFNLKGNLSRHMKVKHGVMDISLDSQGRCRLWPVLWFCLLEHTNASSLLWQSESPPSVSWLGRAVAAGELWAPTRVHHRCSVLNPRSHDGTGWGRPRRAGRAAGDG